MSGATFKLEHYRDECSELKSTLQVSLKSKERQPRQEALQKTLNAMASGTDVTNAYPEIAQCFATDDMVQKRMINQYLARHGCVCKELAMLLINTLLKDCSDIDPVVRAMGLRCLVELKSDVALEYVEEPLKRHLNDNQELVRANAVNCSVSVSSMLSDCPLKAEIHDLCNESLTDSSDLVFQRALMANKALDKSFQVRSQHCYRILNNFKSFDVSALPILLKFVSELVPENDEIFYSILNVIDEGVDTINTGVSVASIDAFVALCKNYGMNMNDKLFQRAKSTMVSLIINAVPELTELVVERLLRIIENLESEIVYKQLKGDLLYLIPSLTDAPGLRRRKLQLLRRCLCQSSVKLITSRLMEVSIYESDHLVISDIAKTFCECIKLDNTCAEDIYRSIFEDRLPKETFSSNPAAFLKLICQVASDLPCYEEQLSNYSNQLSYIITQAVNGAYSHRLNESLLSFMSIPAVIRSVDEVPYVLETMIDIFIRSQSSKSTDVDDDTEAQMKDFYSSKAPDGGNTSCLFPLLLAQATKQVFLCRPKETQHVVVSLSQALLGEKEESEMDTGTTMAVSVIMNNLMRMIK